MPASTRPRHTCASRATGCGASSSTRGATSCRSWPEDVDLAGLGALGLVALEWLALGWLSGVAFPAPPGAVNWALRLLVGGVLVGRARAPGLAGAGRGPGGSQPAGVAGARVGLGRLLALGPARAGVRPGRRR